MEISSSNSIHILTYANTHYSHMSVPQLIITEARNELHFALLGSWCSLALVTSIWGRAWVITWSLANSHSRYFWEGWGKAGVEGNAVPLVFHWKIPWIDFLKTFCLPSPGMAALDSKASGKMGMRAVVYYMTTTIIAVVIGIIIVIIIHPGKGTKENMHREGKIVQVTAADAFLDLIRYVLVALPWGVHWPPKPSYFGKPTKLSKRYLTEPALSGLTWESHLFFPLSEVDIEGLASDLTEQM